VLRGELARGHFASLARFSAMRPTAVLAQPDAVRISRACVLGFSWSAPLQDDVTSQHFDAIVRFS
jgi:hypothetical protein